MTGLRRFCPYILLKFFFKFVMIFDDFLKIMHGICNVYCVGKETGRDVYFSIEHFFIAKLPTFLLLISWNSPIKFTINVSWWSSNVGFRIHHCPTEKRFLIEEGVFVVCNIKPFSSLSGVGHHQIHLCSIPRHFL